MQLHLEVHKKALTSHETVLLEMGRDLCNEKEKNAALHRLVIEQNTNLLMMAEQLTETIKLTNEFIIEQRKTNNIIKKKL